uniref:Uncharacterized protein n=1 Tax=Brassica oleracea TaxID=3712 RepID=A0A3P6B806_BRAOL|nr:unnamed protein product [Brassica oleracea]
MDIEKLESGSDSRELRLRLDTGTTSPLMEAKKAMASDKFAELWVVDPKRPKRFMVWNSNPTRHCPNCHTSLTTVTKL